MQLSISRQLKELDRVAPRTRTSPGTLAKPFSPWLFEFGAVLMASAPRVGLPSASPRARRRRGAIHPQPPSLVRGDRGRATPALVSTWRNSC